MHWERTFPMYEKNECRHNNLQDQDIITNLTWITYSLTSYMGKAPQLLEH
jgi:hypothetical protein